MDKYNIFKIIIDLITFRLKYSTIKTMKQVDELYTALIVEKQPLRINHIKKLKNLGANDIKTCIKFHNKYVKNKDDKIDVEAFLEFTLQKYVM